MNNHRSRSLFKTKWEGEAAQAREELDAIERERALTTIQNLMVRYAITLNEVAPSGLEQVGSGQAGQNISWGSYDPYFDRI